MNPQHETPPVVQVDHAIGSLRIRSKRRLAGFIQADLVDHMDRVSLEVLARTRGRVLGLRRRFLDVAPRGQVGEAFLRAQELDRLLFGPGDPLGVYPVARRISRLPTAIPTHPDNVRRLPVMSCRLPGPIPSALP